MTSRERLMTAAQSGKSSRGKREFLAHLNDQHLTTKQSVYAKCYECSGYYIDSVKSCDDTDCPLFPYHPYNPNRYKRPATEAQKKRGQELVEAKRSAQGEKV